MPWRERFFFFGKRCRGRVLTALKGRPRGTATLVLLAFYVSSRRVVWALGISMDIRHHDSFWHFIEVGSLRHQLWPSLYYLHGQPPGFNLLLAIGLAFGEARQAAFFGVLFFLVGAGGLVLLFLLMTELRVPLLMAAVFAAFWSLTPQVLLYEHYLLYTYPSTVLLLAVAFAFLRAHKTNLRRWWLVFFVAAALTVLCRSLFHPLWLLLLFLACLTFRRGRSWTVVLTAAAPLAVVLTLSIKNVYQFGTFSFSSWFGMNLARITTFQLPATTREQLIASGELSPFAAVRPFSPLPAYQNLVILPPVTGIMMLDQAQKQSGAINMHHLAYVEISRHYAADAIAVVRQAPAAYAQGVLRAGKRFLQPSTRYPPLATNRLRLAGWDSLYSALLHFEIPGLGAVGWMILLLPGMLGFGLLNGWRNFRVGDPTGAGLIFLASHVLYVGLVGCLFEVGENYRFRFLIEPYVLALAAVAGARLLAWRRTRQGRRKGPCTAKG